MSKWSQMYCEAKEINERIFYRPIDHSKLRFFSPGFSYDAQEIKFLAVFDGYADVDNPRAFEFIIGNHDGSGAFTFPHPGLILPFHRVAVTTEPQLDTDVREAPDRAYDFSLSLLDIPKVPRQMVLEEQACNQWIELCRRIRPYHGFYAGRTTHNAVKSTDADIMGLKHVMGHFKEPLLDEQLPGRFRDGVSYILEEDVVAICRRFEIPLSMP